MKINIGNADRYFRLMLGEAIIIFVYPCNSRRGMVGVIPIPAVFTRRRPANVLLEFQLPQTEII